MDKMIKLHKPIQAHGEQVTELKLREPTVKDLLAFDKASGDVGKMVAMISSLTGLPDPSIHEMSAKDFQAVSAEVEAFLADTPATGGK